MPHEKCCFLSSPKHDSERESNIDDDGLDNGLAKRHKVFQSSAHVKFKFPINAPPTERCKVLINHSNKQTNEQTNKQQTH